MPTSKRFATRMHRGYTGEAAYEAELDAYYGAVNNAPVVITFQGDTEEEAEAAFKRSVDESLLAYEEHGLEPAKPEG